MSGSGAAPYRPLFEEAAVGITRVTAGGRIVEANRSLCKLLGYERDELLRRRYDEITHPDDVMRDRDLFARLLAGEIDSCSLEKRYIGKTGAPVHVRVTSTLVRESVVYRLSIVEDVRAGHDAELGRREEQVRLRTVLETVPVAMVVIDARGAVESFSPSAERMFGYPADEVIGRNVSLLMPSPHRERHDSYIERYLSTGQRRIIGIGRVVAGLRKDGRSFPIELSVGEAVLEGRRLFVGFIRDLTEKREAERRLELMQAELTHVARLTEMGQMGSALAHELNQPLTAIAVYLRACSRMLETLGASGTERVNEALDKAAAQADRAGQIIRRLRQFTEKRETERGEEDINKVVEEASTLALVGVKDMGVVVRIEHGSDAVPAVVDKIQIQQVVVNLVRNAVEAMAQSEERTLTVSVKRADGMVVVRVADTGTGLSPEVAERLFKPFVTTKAKGMGVGLSICHRIIEVHHGWIEVEATGAGGTTFAFALPLASVREMG